MDGRTESFNDEMMLMMHINMALGNKIRLFRNGLCTRNLTLEGRQRYLAVIRRPKSSCATYESALWSGNSSRRL